MFILFSVDGYKITYHNLNQTLISVKDVSYQRTFLQHLHFFHQIQIELDKLAYVFEQDQQRKKKAQGKSNEPVLLYVPAKKIHNDKMRSTVR